MKRYLKHRIATSLGLVAIPRGGYASPETVAQIEREIAAADRMIAKKAAEKEGGK
tara:strand:+ start:34810 stop:34974 length:165 start_codon:yes stop_codon:yes gene_type:complete